MLVWFAVAMADPGCPSSAADLESALARLQTVPDDFIARFPGVQAGVHCLADIASPELAAGYHQVRALAASIREDEAAVIDAYRASLVADPTYQPSYEILPAGHKLRDLFDQAATAAPAHTEPVRMPRGTRLVVDGHPEEARPVDRDALLQQVHGSQVLWTRTVLAGEPLPTLEVPPRRNGWAWWAGAGALAVASGGLWAGALSKRAAVANTEGPLIGSDAVDQLTRTQRTGNALGYAAQTTSVATVGVGVIAVVW